MRLTCCCGASIEVKSVIDDLNDTASGDTPALEKFRADHRPCLDKWRARCISWPCWESLPLVEFTPEALAAMQQMNTYPGKSDPYQRFRDAISRDGKRVFVELDGRMHVARQHFGEMYKDSPSNYFIEGVDIPVQPTKEWLNDCYALTGECRVPRERELWAGVAPSGAPIGPLDGICADPAFQGRRWIVRKRVDQPAERMFGTMAEFTKLHCPIVNEAELSQHAAEHDAIVRKLLMDAIHQTIPEHVATNYEGKIHRLGDQVLSPLQPSRRVGQDAPEQEVIECKGIRPVNLHIGQSAAEIVKQARDLVQGMGITKKTKYVAFNIVSDQLIWGVK